jgi:5-phospho-D-xylono-1,4-lactonase
VTGAIVRTVAGDIDPAALGRTDYHEHLLMCSPLLRGDELDDVERSAEEASTLRAAAIDAVVELTPIGVGRDPGGVADIARRSGLNVVLATGVHREAHYPEGHWVHRTDEGAFAERFRREIVDGCDADPPAAAAEPTGVRAGVIKVGTGYWSIAPLERRVLAAAATVSRDLGVAIVCHLEHGTAGIEVLDLLARHGADPTRIAFAHVDRNPDPVLHAELAAAGAYLGYDGAGRAKYWPDQILLDCLLAVADAGHGDRLLLGGDVARRSSFTAYGGLPGMAYLPSRFVPRVRQAGGEALVQTILVDNPARLLAFAGAVATGTARAGGDVRSAGR